MKLREKTEERVPFPKEVRESIYKKSEGVCLHCGRPLAFGTRECTIEHVIPLSKGGTNDEENLVSLCFTCNANKANELVHVSWYKYASESVLQDIKDLYANYMSNFYFLDNNHMLPVDRTFYSAEINMKTWDFPDPKLRKSKRNLIRKVEYEVKRATYNDLGRIIKAYSDYLNNVGVECSSAEINATVVTMFRCGTLYFFEIGDSIVSVIPVFISKVDMNETENDTWKPYADADGTAYIPHVMFYMPICLKRHDVFSAMVVDVMVDIAKMFMEVIDVTSIPLSITGYKDKKLYTLLSRVFTTQEEDNNSYYIIGMAHLSEESANVDHEKLRKSMGVLSSNNKIKFYSLDDLKAEVEMRQELYEREGR